MSPLVHQTTGTSSVTIEAPIDGCYHNGLGFFPIFASDGETTVGFGCHDCGWHTFYPDHVEAEP